jgi:hypothetical protein
MVSKTKKSTNGHMEDRPIFIKKKDLTKVLRHLWEHSNKFTPNINDYFDETQIAMLLDCGNFTYLSGRCLGLSVKKIRRNGYALTCSSQSPEFLNEERVHDLVNTLYKKKS